MFSCGCSRLYEPAIAACLDCIAPGATALASGAHQVEIAVETPAMLEESGYFLPACDALRVCHCMYFRQSFSTDKAVRANTLVLLICSARPMPSSRAIRAFVKSCSSSWRINSHVRVAET